MSHVPLKDNSYKVDSGPFEGWSLAYCKGPDGEQLEFNKVQHEAADAFLQAQLTYYDGGQNELW